MIVFERKVFSFFRYRKVVFPTLDGVSHLLARMAPNDIVRFNYDGCLPPSRNLIDSFPVSTIIIDLRQSLDRIWTGMRRTSCRQSLRRVEKILERVRIVERTDAAAVDFLKLYNGLARAKNGLTRMSGRALRRYLAAADVRVIYLDGRALCGHVNVGDPHGGRAGGLFAANRRLEAGEHPVMCADLNRYLYWHEMQAYRAQGRVSFDLGGLAHESPQTSRFNQFKLSFGGPIVDGYCYTFAGAGRLARMCVRAYEELRRSRIARAVPHI
ncbi:MAG TPA: hypothetical protein VNE82_11555 [Candidatus Binataceae bacterium]|nr:hypothetical protein [Candidatus Binataceae bacterium]